MSRPKSLVEQVTSVPIKKLRLKASLSQENLARRIDVAVSTIRRWEKGQCEPTMTIAQMREFCCATRIDFQKLPQSLIYDDLA